ncbi:MAG: hydrogenase expression/formation protein HypE [Promethearchaeota archaeon]
MQSELIKRLTKKAKYRKYGGSGVGVDAFDDGAVIPPLGSDLELVVTADGHTASPLWFPGGDLGKLAAAGTINDLLVMGATPVAVTSVVLVEEGFELERLYALLDSFNEELNFSEVALLAGDTKVLPRGAISGVVLNTTGLGVKPKRWRTLDSNVRPGDHLILTGSIGDHGVALMAFREGISFETSLHSDVASLTPLLKPVINRFGEYLHAMKDPTRGGLAAALNEWAEKSKVSLWLEEERVLVKPEVMAACEMLGLDPYEVACEGRALLAVPPDVSDEVLSMLRNHELGRDAAIVGEAKAERPGRVLLRTTVGGTRFVDPPVGALIPRIC